MEENPKQKKKNDSKADPPKNDPIESLKEAFTESEKSIEGETQIDESVETTLEDTSLEAVKSQVKLFGYDVPVKVVQNIILFSAFALVLLLFYNSYETRNHKKKEAKFLDRIEEIKRDSALNQSEKAALKIRVENNVVDLFDSILIENGSNLEGRLDELLSNEVISAEMEKVYNSLLLRNNLSDDEYIRVIRNGVSRDISISTKEMVSMLYILITKGNLNKERFNIVYSKGEDGNPVLLLDTHKGNIWQLTNGEFKQVGVENLDKVQNDDEILEVIQDFVKSTRGSIIDMRN